MKHNSSRSDLLKKGVSPGQAAAHFGGRADDEVHGEGSRAGEPDARGHVGTGAFVGHDQHEVNIGIIGGLAVGIGTEKDDLGGAELPDDLIDKGLYDGA
jgi:hypothetical protein